MQTNERNSNQRISLEQCLFSNSSQTQSNPKQNPSMNATDKKMQQKKSQTIDLYSYLNEAGDKAETKSNGASHETMPKTNVESQPVVVKSTTNSNDGTQRGTDVQKPKPDNKASVIATKTAKTKEPVKMAKSSAPKNKTTTKAESSLPSRDSSLKKVASATNKSYLERAFSAAADSKTVNDAIGKTYRFVKKKFKGNSDPSAKKNKPTKEAKTQTGYTQDMLPISTIWNGIVKTTSGHYVMIIEILPINFNNLTVVEQDDIAKTFGDIFRNGPTNFHLKEIVDKSNPQRIISFIKEKIEEENVERGVDDGLISCAQDVIDKIIGISANVALSKRYFLIYRYEGSSNSPEEIYGDLQSTKASIISSLARCGNMVVNTDIANATKEVGEILYYCLNRNACRQESLDERIVRTTYDYEKFNTSAGTNREAVDSDFLACRGLSFGRAGDYWYQEGTYKTCLVLKEKGHPGSATPDWLSNFSAYGDGTEIDVYIKKYPKDVTLAALSQYNRLVLSDIKNMNNAEKRENKIGRLQNNSFVANALKTDEDLFDVCIIVTISADSVQNLRFKKKALVKNLNKQRLYIEEASFNCRQFFYATLPLMDIPISIFNRNKRNYLTSSLESLYMYSSYEFYDPKGYVLGENAIEGNSSLVSINNFNTSMFPNANMSILGMTGSGKTFSTEVIARAMRIIGIRVFFILPIKAYEYLKGCNAIGGQYIQLGPGCKDVINVCEIRPAQTLKLKESVAKRTSLLSQKIAFLITWLQINRLRDPMTVEEADLIEVELTKLYSDFGFTSDNDSVWLDKENGKVRPSPIISDMYDRFICNPKLQRTADSLKKYVSGNCSNMNAPTNVDYTNMYNCIDVDEENIPKDLLPAFLMVAFEWAYSLVKENRLTYDCVFLDEIWKLLINDATTALVKDMLKLIRGYGGAVVPITQDINDYLDNPAGKAILSGTAIKLIMHLERPEGQRVAEVLSLPEEDIRMLQKFGRGQVLLLAGTNKVPFNIKASEKEIEDFTTDTGKLRSMAKRGV